MRKASEKGARGRVLGGGLALGVSDMESEVVCILFRGMKRRNVLWNRSVGKTNI